MTRRDAFVAEDPTQFVDALHAADDQPLQVELGRDAKRQVQACGCLILVCCFGILS